MRLSNSAVEHLRGLADWPDLTGTRYGIERLLGRGGMGTVYLATDYALGREVALKVLSVPDPALADRLSGEARILARLEHPGLVPVHDVGVLADGRPYYVMKFVRGIRLDAYAASTTDVAGTLRIFLRICETIAFAHAAGVVHRDLTPANVMIGPFGEVLVLDWGAARLLADPETRPGTVAGTPGYMAPEQVEGRSDESDARTDVYALGAVLDRLCGGAAPAIDAIARVARATRPEDRYQSAADLAADVARFLAGAPVLAYPESVAGRLVRIVRRHAMALTLIAAYVVVRVILIAFR